MINFVFLSGTSSVGKTEFLNSLQEIEGGAKIKTVKLSAREPRALMGNPAYEDLTTFTKIHQHQYSIFEFFFNKTFDVVGEAFKNYSGQSETYVFERCLDDVYAYYLAFCHKIGLSELRFPHDEKTLSEDLKMAKGSIVLKTYCDILSYKTGIDSQFATFLFSIDHSYPYDRQNGARPEGYIRNTVDVMLPTIDLVNSLEANIDHYRKMIQQGDLSLPT